MQLMAFTTLIVGLCRDVYGFNDDTLPSVCTFLLHASWQVMGIKLIGTAKELRWLVWSVDVDRQTCRQVKRADPIPIIDTNKSRCLDKRKSFRSAGTIVDIGG